MFVQRANWAVLGKMGSLVLDAWAAAGWDMAVA